MRVKLTLKPLEENCPVPINYQYPLSKLIYKILKNYSENFASMMHDKGYQNTKGKKFKMFVFSKLYTYNYTHHDDILLIRRKTPCHVFISSPMIKDFLPNLIKGISKNRKVFLESPKVKAPFVIEEEEILPSLNISNEQATHSFKCLSPIIVSTKAYYNNKLGTKYLNPKETEFIEGIKNNLLEKRRILEPDIELNDDFPFSIEWDKNYVAKRGGFEKTSKLIAIKEGRKNMETQMRGFILPFQITAPGRLIQIAYDCGIGEKNSTGFGMIEITK